MLVFGRKPGETLVIGDAVKVTIVRIEGSRVTLGIEAPRDLLILRGELLERADEPIYVEVSIEDLRP